jgi:hypothetical protein
MVGLLVIVLFIAQYASGSYHLPFAYRVRVYDPSHDVGTRSAQPPTSNNGTRLLGSPVHADTGLVDIDLGD